MRHTGEECSYCHSSLSLSQSLPGTGDARSLAGLTEAPGGELPSLRLQPETEPRG